MKNLITIGLPSKGRLKENTVRFVGGCIRKIINREEVDDIDLATNITPDEVCKALNKHEIKFFEYCTKPIFMN